MILPAQQVIPHSVLFASQLVLPAESAVTSDTRGNVAGYFWGNAPGLPRTEATHRR